MIKYQKLLNFTYLYRFNKPFNTESKIINIDENKFIDTENIFYFNSVEQNEKEVKFFLKLDKNDAIYGLGESLGGLNKRGKKYRMFNNDDPLHTPEKESLYGSHPFVIVEKNKNFGFFIDYSSEIIFDIGFTNKNLFEITISSNNFDLYIFDNNNKFEIIKEFLLLTGSPYLPPKWSFGYMQSRWSYPDENTIEQIVINLKNNDIPCDAIFLDIDYMENYKVFTIDKKKFSDFKKFCLKLKDKGINLVPIIDPGVKIEKKYDIYEQGVKNNYFCKDKNNKNFIGTVWPGKTCFPDFINKKTREWWGKQYKFFVDMGINGFWNDMNEPAIFFTPQGINELKKYYNKNIKNKKDIGFDFFGLKDRVCSISNRIEDYKNIIHIDDNNNKINHIDIHNLYGYFMAKATMEQLEKDYPNKRFFLLSRSSYIGLHRIAAIWMGDNQSWWEHLLVNIRMLQSLNICGFFYTGADIGGFGGNSNSELLIRWFQLAIFSPMFRNHSAFGTRNQEPWAFDKHSLEILTNIIKIRYCLVPYLYSEFINSIKNLNPFIKPISFIYNNDIICKSIEDQFFVGSSIMAIPVYKENSKGRFVYLPENKWLLVKIQDFRELFDINNNNLFIYGSGSYFIDYDIDFCAFFIKENSLITYSNLNNLTIKTKIEELYILVFITDFIEYNYFDDDGETLNYKQNIIYNLNIKIKKNNKDYDITITQTKNYNYNIKKLIFFIYDDNQKLIKKEIIINS